MKLVPRKVALEKGLPRYFTGIACKYGHIAERTTKRSACVECNRKRNLIHTPHDSLKKRERNLKSRYKMELTEFVERVETQANRCALCRNLSKKLIVDHCHSRDKVRELLCSRCNTLLGLAEDSIDLLHAATDYLVKHS